MNVRLEDNYEKNKKLKIVYITIISICILAVLITIIIQIVKSIDTSQPPSIVDERLTKYKESFNEIFENKVNYLENNNYKIDKIDNSKEIIYTGYSDKNNKISDYNLDVNIPYINIQNSVIDGLNNEIKEVFEKKARDILNTQKQNIIYSVNYCSYITNNILSLVIRANLKEGENPARDIVQTYNYDLINQKEVSFEDMLELKSVSRLDASRKINAEIKEIENEVKNMSQLGYSVYPRNSSDEIYDIDNITEFFIGEDNALYVIFAYGNQNNTSEMDIVVL